jgi:hypothetical protein
MRNDWANFQTQLEDQIPSDLELHNGMAIDARVVNFSGAALKSLVASTPKCRPRAEPRPPIPAGIQDEIRLKDRLRRRWQVTRDPALKAEVNCLQRSVTRRLKEWWNAQCSKAIESLDPEYQSLWRITKRMVRVPTPSPPLVTPGGIALSDSEKAEDIAESLEIQFRPVADTSVTAVLTLLTRSWGLNS